MKKKIIEAPTETIPQVFIVQPELPQTMLDPFTGTQCNVKRLQPGDVVDANDMYRSSTVKENGTEAGRWLKAGEILRGSVIGDGLNVAMIRLTPVQQK